MRALRELQSALIGALLDDGVPAPPGTIRAAGIAADRRLGIYANNAFANLAQSLRLGFPVVNRLVGDAYFDQCVRDYRRRYPSRSGDLHDAGARFPAYLAARHRGGRHRYLGEVARFERLCEAVRIAAERAPLEPARLAEVAPADYERLRLRLQPSARPFASRYPVREIWEANVDPQVDPGTIDLDRGGDRLLVVRSADGLEFHRFGAGELVFVRALRRRQALGAAIAAAQRADAAFDPGAALRRLAGLGVLAGFTLPRDTR